MATKNIKKTSSGNEKRIGQGEKMNPLESRPPFWKRRGFQVTVAVVAFLSSCIAVGEFGVGLYKKNLGFKSHGVYQFKGIDSKFKKPLFNDLAKTASGRTLELCEFHYDTGREQYIDEALQNEINNPKNQSILLLRKAEAYFQKNDFPATLSLVDTALRLYPGNVHALEVSIAVRRKVLYNLINSIPAKPTSEDSGIIKKTKELASEIEALEERLRVFDPSDYSLLGYLLLNKHETAYEDSFIGCSLFISEKHSPAGRLNIVTKSRSIVPYNIINKTASEDSPLGYSLLNSEKHSPASIFNIVTKSRLIDSYGLYDNFLDYSMITKSSKSIYLDSLATKEDRGSSLKTISIGVDNYDNSEFIDSLDFAASDAERVTKSLASYGFDIKLLRNNEATNINIVDALSNEVSSSKPGDTLVLYISSHGISDYEGNRYILTYIDKDKKAQLLSVKLIESLLEAYKGDAYVLIDSCFDKFNFSSRDMYDERIDLPFGKKPMLLLGSSLGEKAIESKQLKSGLFTYALIEYLERHKNTTARGLDFIRMSDYVKGRTSYLAYNLYGLKQTPDVSLTNQSISRTEK